MLCFKENGNFNVFLQHKEINKAVKSDVMMLENGRKFGGFF